MVRSVRFKFVNFHRIWAAANRERRPTNIERFMNLRRQSRLAYGWGHCEFRKEPPYTRKNRVKKGVGGEIDRLPRL